jgi:hypothetical protein
VCHPNSAFGTATEGAQVLDVPTTTGLLNCVTQLQEQLTSLEKVSSPLSTCPS